MPRSQGSTTLAVGEHAPDFDVHVAGTGERTELQDFADGWLYLVFLRHVW
ncbi:MAG: hypothetical protein OXG33_09725 [Chloroflexi bacterium]|nr:hypothetical protein [Chloroflexota bacterium]